MKYTMLANHWTRWTLLLSIGIAPTLGCQSGRSGLFSQQNLQARKQSLDNTPLAQAKSGQSSDGSQSDARTSAIARTAKDTPASYGVNANSNVVQASAIAAGKDNSVVTPEKLPTDTSRVVPVQHTQRAVDSYSVPREPMPTAEFYAPSSGMQGYHPGSIPINQAPAPTVQQPSSANSHRHTSGHNCPHCNHGGGSYQPVFPQLQGAASCNEGMNAGSMIPCSPEAMFVSPRLTDPQEYLYDGGDKEPLVRLRKDDSLSGLDPEDTVVQYETADGRTMVESGCRVSIYAPRFASVRKKTSSVESDLSQRLRTTERPDGPGQLVEKLPSQHVSKPLRSYNQENVSVVEAVRDRKVPTPADGILPMLVAGDVLAPYADIALLKTGNMNGTDMAKLAIGTTAAHAWTNVDEIHVMVDGTEAIEASGSKRAKDLYLYEFKGARIRLCKVASEQMANPGDVISFTIRFDNVGEQPLRNLVVSDSLTPRLEFVPGSSRSSMETSFSTTPNAVGSEVLRWEIKGEIKPGEGGLVRFDCKVR